MFARAKQASVQDCTVVQAALPGLDLDQTQEESMVRSRRRMA
jgi:hypothetical protein